MGILNATPDSFFDGGKCNSLEKALQRARQIQDEGAHILDIGAQSTRPGHIPVSADEEINRLIPILEKIRNQISIPISIDTYYPEVVRETLKYDVKMVNDVSGHLSEDMAKVVKEANLGWIITHTGLSAENEEDISEGLGALMNLKNESNFESASSIISRVKFFFEKAYLFFEKKGIDAQSIVLDPGIGFGKNSLENIEILANLDHTRVGERPIMIGLSRKRFIGQVIGEDDPQNRLYGSLGGAVASIASGANIIRVHDVKESVQAIRVADEIFCVKK